MRDWNDDTTVHEFIKPMITEYTMTMGNNLKSPPLFGGKFVDFIKAPTIKCDFSLMAKDINCISGKAKPEDFYTLSELTKLSKLITRKIGR